jgi:hypothetical protein
MTGIGRGLDALRLLREWSALYRIALKQRQKTEGRQNKQQGTSQNDPPHHDVGAPFRLNRRLGRNFKRQSLENSYQPKTKSLSSPALPSGYLRVFTIANAQDLPY